MRAMPGNRRLRAGTAAPTTLPVGLSGAHQQRNAACALAAVDELEALGVVAAPAELRARALAQVRHPGRMELVPGSPPIWLDGAHNPHGAAALAEAAAALPAPRALVLAVSADKDVAGILAPLVPVFATLVATRYQQPRALDPAALATAARAAGFTDVSEAPSLPDALLTMVHSTIVRSVVIAGSLMLVGEARSRLVGAPTDPMVVTDPAP